MMTEQELAEYKEYLATQGFKPEEADEYLTSQGMAQKEPGMVSKGLDYLSRGLDYAGGLTRTTAAQVADPFVDEDIVNKEDWKNAFKGKAPNTAEYMERAKIPEGAKVDFISETQIPFTNIKVGEGDTSVRDAVGFVGDIALDPLTYLSAGTKPLSQGAMKSGKSLYKSGLKKVDEKLIERGTKPVSDILFQEGKWGGNQSLLNEAEKLAQEKGQLRSKMYGQAEKAGVNVDPKSSTKYAQAEIDKLKRDPGLQDMAALLEEKLAAYNKAPKTSLSQMSEWKTNIYDSLPTSAYDQFGKLKGPAQKYQRSLAKGMKETIEEGAERSGVGGQNLSNLNEDIGSLLASKKPLSSEVKKANTKNAVSSVDGILGGISIANPTMGLPALALKKAADVSKSTSFRTGAGLGANAVGKRGFIDPLAQRILIESMREEQNKNPWDEVKKSKSK